MMLVIFASSGPISAVDLGAEKKTGNIRATTNHVVECHFFGVNSGYNNYGDHNVLTS